MAQDTIKKTFGVALGVCLVCSVLVSAAAVSLKPAASAFWRASAIAGSDKPAPPASNEVWRNCLRPSK